jgi:hypothetical protein
MQTIDEALNKLKKSDFRSRFHLKQKDIDYINEKGMDKTAPMQKILSEHGLHQNIFRMTESKRL